MSIEPAPIRSPLLSTNGNVSLPWMRWFELVTVNSGVGLATLPLDHTNGAHITGTGSNTHTQIDAHLASTSNPHSVTKTQVGLSNVENTALSTWAGSTNLTTLGTLIVDLNLGTNSVKGSDSQTRLGSTTSAPTVVTMTTTQRDALTPVNGMMIYNSTTGDMEKFEDAAWAAIGAGGGASPLTTKGDLYTFDSADARLPVGTNGQVLVSDSVETTGIRWTSSVEAFDGGQHGDTFIDTVDFDAGGH